MEAQETRNLIMDMVRTRSTPLGRAMAERMKTSGVTLNELVAKKLPLCSGQGLTLTAYQKRKKSGLCRYCRVSGKIKPSG